MAKRQPALRAEQETDIPLRPGGPLMAEGHFARAFTPGQLAARLNTLPLQQDATQTVALVVFNEGDAPYTGLVSFDAAFPVRREQSPRPVLVRDVSGNVLPSRLALSRVSEKDDLPPDRVLWTLTLHFFVADLPPHSWHAYSATFEDSPASRANDIAFWSEWETRMPDQRPHVQETGCHAGNLPLQGTYDIISR